MSRTRPTLTRAARGVAALLLATSLAACGALGSSVAKKDETSPAAPTSTSSEGSAEPSERASSDPSDTSSATPGDTSSASPTDDESAPAAQGEEQPAGSVDNPATWLANTPYVPLKGIEGVTVDVLQGGPSGDGTFTLSFTFEHPNASQSCVDAVAKLNEFEVPIQGMAIAKYEGDFEALDETEGAATVQSAAVVTKEDLNLGDAYNDVISECANTPGEPKAVVEKLPGHDGIHARLGSADLLIVCKSHGNRHVWMILANVEPEQAKTYIDAQIDLFDRTVTNAA